MACIAGSAWAASHEPRSVDGPGRAIRVHTGSPVATLPDAQLLLGIEGEAGHPVLQSRGCDSVGEVVRVQFGAEFEFEPESQKESLDIGVWTASVRVVAASATLFTRDGGVVFTWGLRSLTVLAPKDSAVTEGAVADLYRPLGIDKSPLVAASTALEAAQRLGEIGLGGSGPSAGVFTPSLGWPAFWACYRACLETAFRAHFENLLICLGVPANVLPAAIAACFAGCGLINVPCLLSCLGAVSLTSSATQAACIAAYLGGLQFIPPACAAFCW